MEAKQQPANRAHDLAVRIYVELVARNTAFPDGSIKMATSAANLATLSLKLAEAFLEAEAQAIAAKEPVKDYKLGADDIAKWMK